MLPDAKLLVEGYEGPRGGHLYRAKRLDGTVLADALPSVTRKLDIIGGDKTEALMGWAVKESLRHVSDFLTQHAVEGCYITPGLIEEAVKVGRKRPEKIKDAAGELGTRIHACIDEWILTGKTRTLTVDEATAFKNFRGFVDKARLKFICGDLAVASVKYRYGGRLDALAMMGNKLVLLDWKTSNAIRDDYALQVAGYRLALKETYGLNVDRALVVRFDKVDPEVLDYREVALGQATKTWKALVAFESEFYKGAWK